MHTITPKFEAKGCFGMKRKRLLVVCFIFLATLALTACGDENNPINKRYTEDRSSLMPDIPQTDEQFNMYLRQQIIPINNAIYTLSMQAQQLKAGTGSINAEIERVDNILNDIQNRIEGIMDIKVSSQQEERKQAVIEALNNLKIQLSSYKNVLSSENVTKADVQSAIDIIMGALETVKQYTS